MAITVQSDLLGFRRITQDASINSDDDLSLIIAETEEWVLTSLMGDKLYIEANTDGMLDNNPTADKFKNLLNGENYVDSNSRTVRYIGLKRMLQYFIYYSWKVFKKSEDSQIGTVINQGDNVIRPSTHFVDFIANESWDKGVKLYNQALKYINDKNNLGTNIYFEDTSDWTYKQIKPRSKPKRVTIT